MTNIWKTLRILGSGNRNFKNELFAQNYNCNNIRNTRNDKKKVF